MLLSNAKRLKIQGIIKRIAQDKKLLLYKHKGFWKSVDTLKDLNELSIFLKNKK